MLQSGCNSDEFKFEFGTVDNYNFQLIRSYSNEPAAISKLSLGSLKNLDVGITFHYPMQILTKTEDEVLKRFDVERYEEKLEFYQHFARKPWCMLMDPSFALQHKLFSM